MQWNTFVSSEMSVPCTRWGKAKMGQLIDYNAEPNWFDKNNWELSAFILPLPAVWQANERKLDIFSLVLFLTSWFNPQRLIRLDCKFSTSCIFRKGKNYKEKVKTIKFLLGALTAPPSDEKKIPQILNLDSISVWWGSQDKVAARSEPSKGPESRSRTV